MTALLLLSILPALASVTMALELTYEPVVFAVQAINNQFKNNGDTTPRVLAEIMSAQAKNIAGQLLYLDLRLTGGTSDDYCYVVVWYRAWLNDTDRSIITAGPVCSKTPVRRQLAGGISDPIVVGTSPAKEVADALNFAVCAVNDASNDMFFSVLGDTSHVTYTQQVTAGMTYRFYKVPLLTSSCRKQANRCQDTDLSACAVSANARPTSCDLSVQSQPWLTPAYTLLSMSCH